MTPQNSRLYPEVRELLSRYQAASPKLEIEYLDPERNLARAEALVKEFGIHARTRSSSARETSKKYVEEDKLADFDFAGMGMGGGAPTIKAFKGEEAFTSAILSVTEARAVPRLLLEGPRRGGDRLRPSAGRGYADAKQLLERDNMTVGTWDSLGKDALPADADVLIVAGPRTAFLEPEAGALEKYLAGGRTPAPPARPGAARARARRRPDFGFKGLLEKYGIKLGDDLVVDPANALPMVGAETVLANRYGTHPIVRSLSAEGLPVILPLARSVTKAEKPPEGIAETMLVETSPEGWGETNLKQLDSAIKKEPGDTPGPVSLAIALGPADEKKPDAKAPRMVVIGNSRFASNGALANGANGILLANAVHWLAGSEKQIGIAPKTPEQASVSLTAAQVRRLGIASVFGLPGLAILLGLWVWYRRRD